MTTPARIGRFEIEREAASGAAGTVFRARDPDTGRIVGIKRIHGVLDADLQRFAREARILAQIRHPGVVRYVDHGFDEPGEAYLVMEWLEGEDLRQRLARAGLSLAETIALGRRVAESLAVVHGHGLIHRDIKPGNLFLPGGLIDEVKIIDFGLAREDASRGPTLTGTVVGTPSYMAPEQARGSRGMDARADLYSLGCVLFKALTGRVPFPGQEIAAVLTKVLFEEPPRVGSLRPRVPVELDDLVAGLLAKEPADRPPSASDVARLLEGLSGFDTLDDETPTAPSSAPASGLMVSEQRRLAILLVAPDPARPDDAVEACVQRQGGRLDRLLDGTRVAAFSGGPASDQAARAARCALALRALLPSAPMVVATCRSEVDRGLVLGAAVDRAAGMLRQRIAATAEEARPVIDVDEVTAALLDPRFDVRAEGGELTLHGLHEVERGVRCVLGKEVPFVGREWELSSILSLFDRCVDDETALALLVTAPAGMGKTRLAHEAVRALSVRRPEVEVWWARGDPLRTGSSLELLAQAVRSACGVREGDPLPERCEQLRRRAALRLPPGDAARVARFLGELVGAPFPDDDAELRAARQDARIMGEQMRRAFCDFVAVELAARPAVLLLEDLQWADPSTVRVLDDALQRLSHLPWMVLALARPEVAALYPRLWRDCSVQEIRLQPLPRRAGERLVREVLGERAAADTAARLAARAEGNAFYLEEMIRAVAGGAGPEAFPETVLAMVQTRLEGLAPELRRALRAASLFGEVFWPGAVAALLGEGSGPPSEGWIDDLVRLEVLVRRPESRYAGEEEVAFRHALVREGAYAMLTEADRVLGHRLAGEWLEPRSEGDPMLLARHFELGDEAARAGIHLLRAAEHALRGADLVAACAHAERALASGLAGQLRLACLGMLGEAHSWRAEWELSGRYAAQVMELAAPGSALWLQGVTVMQAAAFTQGRSAEFMAAVFTLAGVDPDLGSAGTAVHCLAIGVLVCCFGAQFAAAAGLLPRIDLLVAPIRERDPVAAGWSHLAHGFHEAWKTGALWAALGHVEAAHRSFESVSDRRGSQLARLVMGMVEWNLGLFDEAESALRSVAQAGDDQGVAQGRDLYLALVLIERGALDEARDLALRRTDPARAETRGNTAIREAQGRWLLGEIAARTGDLGVASHELGEAVEVLRLIPLTWPLVAGTLASVRLRQGRVADAVALGRDVAAAVAALGGAGMRAGRARLVLAESLLAAGDPTADAVLATARDELLARAGGIPDAEIRRRFLTALPEHERTLALAEERLIPHGSPAS